MAFTFIHIVFLKPFAQTTLVQTLGRSTTMEGDGIVFVMDDMA
jgi:hypothetical protein